MTRSGIKQGLAVSAVSALTIVGLPAAAHAAPVSTAYQMNLTASSTSVVTGQATKYTLTVKNQNGGVATGTVDIRVSEAAANPVGTETNPLAVTNVDDDADSSTPAISGAKETPNPDSLAGGTAGWDDTVTVTLDAKGQATFDVASSKAGAVTVLASSNGASVSSTLTVAAAASGQDAVTSLVSSAATVDNYLADVVAQKVNITPLAGGTAMAPGVVVNYTITGPAGTTPKQGTATSVAPDAYSAPVAAIPLTGLTAGNWTLKAWVNKTTGTTTPGLDAGEQSTTVAINAVADPTVHNDAAAPYANLGGFSTTATVDATTGKLLPADGAATSVPLSARLLDDTTGKPAAGVSVGFDVVVDTPATGTPDAKRYQATTDANGVATVSVPVSAAEAVAGTTIAAELVVSKSTDPAVGPTAEVAAHTVLTFATRTPALTIVDVADGIQAASGGKVTVPVKVADQFGKAVSGVAVTGTVTGARDAGATVTGGTTDASGNTSVSFNDTGVAGTSTVTVSATGLGTDSTTVTYLSSLAPALVTIPANGQVVNWNHYDSNPDGDPSTNDGAWVNTPTPVDALPAGTSANVVVDATPTVPGNAVIAKVVNATGQVLTNAAVQVSVDNGLVNELKAATPGTLVGATATKNRAATITVKTDEQGFIYVGAGAFKVGAQTLTITAGTAAPIKTKVVNYIADAPYSVTTSSSLSLTQGEQGKVVAKVTDQYGNPISGVNLTFAQTGSGAFAGGASTAFAVTAADGTASVTVDSLNKVGSGTVTVTAGFAPITTPQDDAMVSAYTKPLDVKYSVSAKPVNNGGGNSGGGTTPPAKPVIGKVVGKSQGKKDVLKVRVANANGKTVVVKVNGKRVGKAVVKNGVATVKVVDKNGKKATKYSAIVSGVKKTFKVK